MSDTFARPWAVEARLTVSHRWRVIGTYRTLGDAVRMYNARGSRLLTRVRAR